MGDLCNVDRLPRIALAGLVQKNGAVHSGRLICASSLGQSLEEGNFAAVLHHKTAGAAYVTEHINDARALRNDQVSGIDLYVVFYRGGSVVLLQFHGDILFRTRPASDGNSR